MGIPSPLEMIMFAVSFKNEPDPSQVRLKRINRQSLFNNFSLIT